MKSAKKISYCLFACAFFVTSLVSCKKDSVMQSSTPQALSNGEETASVTRYTEDGNQKLVLRPCDKDGNDTYVTFWNGDPEWANSTGDFAQELSMDSWTINGILMGVRSFIQFDSLSLIPAASNIISARLCLYTKGSSISNPNGNSIYPGSPYNKYPDNSCKIERVIGGDWNEATLTWAIQPAVTSTDMAIIPISNSQWDYNVKIDVTNLVKTMVADPSSNFGFRIILTNENIYRSMIFASSENADPKRRPKLVIQYN